MKLLAPLLIVLLFGIIVYNISTINFQDSLTSEENRDIYMKLVAQVLVLISLLFSYRRYSKMAKEKSKQ